MLKETDSISNGCYCSEVTFKPCPYCVLNDRTTWNKLTADEKEKALAYKRIILTGRLPSKLMSVYINGLHDKYPDFGIHSIP